MTYTVRPGPIHGRLRAPASRPHTLAAYALAALSGNGSVYGALRSPETDELLSALERLGFLVGHFPPQVRVGGKPRPPHRPIRIEESGEVLGTVLGLATLLDAPVEVRAGERLKEGARTVVAELGAVGVLDASWKSGPPRPVTLPSGASDAAAVAVLLAAAARRARADVPAPPGTVASALADELRSRNVRVSREKERAVLPEGQRVVQRTVHVPASSEATAFLTACVLSSRGTLELDAPLPSDVERFFTQLGGAVQRFEWGVQLSSAGSNPPPVVTTIAAFRPLASAAAVRSPRGVAIAWREDSLRGATLDLLRSSGIGVEASGDQIHVTPSIPKGILVEGFYDERVRRPVVVLALAAQAPTRLPAGFLSGPEYPDLAADLTSIGALEENP